MPNPITRLETDKLGHWWSQPANRVNSALMRAATRLGDGFVWLFVAPVVWWLHGSAETFAIAWRATLVGVASVIIYKFLKGRFNRPRPFDRDPSMQPLHTAPDRFSFPSGHTMNNTAVTLTIAHFDPRFLPILLPFTVLVGFSRVYLRVHYATDVVIGFLLGTGIAMAARFFPFMTLP